MGTLGGPRAISTTGQWWPEHKQPGSGRGRYADDRSSTPQNNPYACFPGPNVNHAIPCQTVTASNCPHFPGRPELQRHQSMGGTIAEKSVKSEISVMDPVLGVKEIHSFVWKDGHG